MIIIIANNYYFLLSRLNLGKTESILCIYMVTYSEEGQAKYIGQIYKSNAPPGNQSCNLSDKPRFFISLGESMTHFESKIKLSSSRICKALLCPVNG